MLPYSFIGAGTYLNAASALPTTVALSDQPDWFFVKDVTNFGAQSTAANPVYAEWFSSMANGSYLAVGQPSSTGTGVVLYSSQGTTNGFSFINSASPPTYSLNTTGTAINHTTFVVSMTDTHTQNLQVGDTVRLINPVGMLEAGGIVAQITAVTLDTSITLGYIATAVTAGVSFHADGTTVSIQKFYPGKYYPAARQIMYISQANQAKVYFARPNDFTPGELVDFNIPVQYGMLSSGSLGGLNFLTGLPGGAARVLVVTNTATESSITINVNTNGFTPFVYPTSASSVGQASPPTCLPAGSGIVPLNGSATVPQSPPGTNLQDAFDNHNQYYMYIGSSVVGANNATMQWMAFKADYGNLTNA
jgi:hypothetical protein